jgi:hypothetical protein
MHGRVATVVFAAVSVSAAQDFFEITPADDKPVEIIGLMLTQVGNSDVGDAAEEILRFSIIRGHTTSGSGGSAPTPRAIKPASTVSFTAEVNNTTIASAGTTHILHEDAFNVRAGYINWWPLGAEPKASQADTTIVVRLNTAPADAITLSGTLYVREM